MIGIMQVAVEALEHGVKQSQAVTWTAVAMAIVANVGTWLVILKRNSKKVTPNPGPAPISGNSKGPRPGEGETCREHGEAIAGLIVSKDNTEKALVRIESKVDLLLGREG